MAATVAAIAPPGFVGAMQLIAADVWLPASALAALSRTPNAATVPMFGVMGRLPHGVTHDQARARLSAALAGPSTSLRPGPSASLRVGPAPSAIVREASGFGVPPSIQPTVVRGSAVIFGVMALLIAVAAGNVAALVLARSAGRHAEIAVRAALGADRWRLIRQMLTESLVLALAGGAVGWLLAIWVTEVLASQSETTFEYVAYAVDVQPDARVAAYTGLIVFATAALFGVAPAWQAARTDLVGRLKRFGGAGRHTTSRLLRLLVAGQIAFSTALLAGCGLLVRSYVNALAVDPGIDTPGIVAMEVDFGQLGLSEGEGRRLWNDLRERLSAIPGVTATSGSSQTPLSGSGTDARIWIDAAEGRGPMPLTAASEIVTPEHFQLLDIAVLAGRTFRAAEPDAPLVAIVNQTLAARIAPGGSAVGRRFRAGDPSSAPIEVIGVAADVKHRSLTEPARPAFYRPFGQAYSARMTLLARLEVPLGRAADAMRQAVRGANPDLAIVTLRSLDDQRRIGMSFMRRAAIGLGVICALGLVLSAVGLYGIVSYGVRERAREFGIRLALGARAADVRWMIMREGYAVASAGLLLGIGMSLLLTRVLQAMVFGVGVRDPLTMAAVCAVLLAASSAALYVPARWATRLDPAATLRSE
jgi:putative ABC transport system permease protein